MDGRPDLQAEHAPLPRVGGFGISSLFGRETVQGTEGAIVLTLILRCIYNAKYPQRP